MLFLHKLWPVMLDNIIADITIKIFHCIASKTYFTLLWERVNFTRRLNQSSSCCVLALNMIKISSQFRLTTDILSFFFFNLARSFPGTKTHRTFLAGLYTAWATQTGCAELFVIFLIKLLHIFNQLILKPLLSHMYTNLLVKCLKTMLTNTSWFIHKWVESLVNYSFWLVSENVVILQAPFEWV